MRTTTTIWAMSVAVATLCGPLLTTAEAAPAVNTAAQPRYYFPRHVKRQFPNVTEPAVAYPSTSPEVTTRQTGGGFLSDLLNLNPDEPSNTPSDKPSNNPSDSPSDAPSGSQQPSSSGGEAPSSQSDGGLLGPVLSPLLPKPTPSSSVGSTGGVPESPLTPTTAPVSSDGGETPVETPAQSSAGLLDPILTNLLPQPSTAETPVETPIATPIPTDVGTTGGVPASYATPSPTPEDSGLLDPILSPILTPILTPTPTPEPVPTSGDITVGLSSAIGTEPSQAPSGLIPGLSSILDTLLPGSPSPTADYTNPETGTSPTPTSDGGLIPSIVSGLTSLLTPITGGTPTPGITGPSTGVSDVPTGVPTPGTSVATPSDATPSDATPTGASPTDATPSGATPSKATPSDSLPTEATPTGAYTTGATPSEATPSEPPATTAQPTFVLTQTPVGTNSLTSQIIETSIWMDPTPSGTEPVPTPSGIPTEMPKVIQPPGGMATPPANSTLVQIGFKRELNYPFVVRNSESPMQIFSFLGQGVKDGLKLKDGQVVMNSIRPYDTTGTMGYVTTLVMFYIPSDMFDKLNIDLHTPRSALYSNDVQPVADLMNVINTAIPLQAGELPDSGSPNNPYSADPTNPSGTGDDSGTMDGGAGSKSPVVASSVGIAFAAIGGVAAYGAAMFFIARRYKKKRAMRGHNRNSSVDSSQRSNSEMAYNGVTPAWMSGAHNQPDDPFVDGRDSRNSDNSNSTNERSVRTAQISAPVAAENSLGWN